MFHVRVCGYQLISWIAAICLAIFAVQSKAAEDPFADSTYPAPSWYSGPTFELSHDYATNPEPPSVRPWTQTLAGASISKATAPAYTQALKKYVETDMKELLFAYEKWDAAKRGWYDQPWLSSIREPIHGMFIGTQTSAGLFNDPTLSVKVVNNFVAVYYNRIASYTLGKFWGKGATAPDFSKESSQFPEGAVVVKFAFTEVNGNQWPAMKGAPRWQIYAKRLDEATGQKGDTPEMFDVFLMQMDVIVKDTQAAPKTGWVFSTFIFDNLTGGDPWEQMIPLGAMWGNDPDVNSTFSPAELKETWINPSRTMAPYALATLGWGGRLSGPNDQAAQAPGDYIDPSTGRPGLNAVANSSCMSCHGPAEWPETSFLLPGVNGPAGYFMAPPGSPLWTLWFQDRSGTEPQDARSDALDYDMMFAFKALPHWSQATGKSARPLDFFLRPSSARLQMNANSSAAAESDFLGYNGLPLKTDR